MKLIAVATAFLVTLFNFYTFSAVALRLQPIAEVQSSCAPIITGRAKPDIFFFEKSTFFEELKSVATLSNQKLIQYINAFLQRELDANNGELSGIGPFHGGLKEFLSHLDQTDLFANFLGNALSGTHYRLVMPGDLIRVPLSEPKLGPSFRLEEYIYFNEFVVRLNSSPRQMYAAVGAPFPGNSAAFRNSLERLNGIFKIPATAN